jgi:TonB family protein
VKTPALIFEWPSRHRIHLFLPFAIFSAALLHAAIFFLFSVKHPPSKSSGTNPARLYFLPSNNPEYSRIESALYSSDPALFAPKRGLPPQEELPNATYTPQYAKATIAWDEPPLRTRTPNTDRVFKGPIRISPKKSPLPLKSSPRATRIRASEEINARLPEVPALPKFQSHSTRTPETATWMIAISPDGSVLHSIPDKSSGDLELDRAALAFLRKIPFSPSQQSETVWGFVEFQWGSDVLPPTKP